MLNIGKAGMAAALMGAVALLCGLSSAADMAIQANAATKAPVQAQKAPAFVYIDVHKLPKEIELEAGQSVIFVRNKRVVGSAIEVKAVQTDRVAGDLFKPIASPRAADGNTFALAGWTVDRKGSGYFRVDFTAVVPFPDHTNHSYVKVKFK